MTDNRSPVASRRFLSTTTAKTFQLAMMSVSFTDVLSSTGSNLMAALIVSFALALHNLFWVNMTLSHKLTDVIREYNF